MVLIVIAAAIVVGAVAVALGRGGEMAQFTAEFVLFDPDDADDLTATDVAMLRPPSAVWGYHMQATDQALSVIARTITVRDVEIATLRRQLAEAQSAADLAAGQAPSPPWAPSPPLPPPRPWAPSAAEAEAAGALGPAAASPPLTSRPSVWRREVADQQPAAEHPAAGPWPAAGQWPRQDPWSAWERPPAPAAGLGPDAVPEPGAAGDAGAVPEPGASGDAGAAWEIGAAADAGTAPDSAPGLGSGAG